MIEVDERTCDNYRRPKGVMGGPCLNCGQSQPDHAWKRQNGASAKTVPDPRPIFARVDVGDGDVLVVALHEDAWRRVHRGEAIAFDANEVGVPARILFVGAPTQATATMVVEKLATMPATLKAAFDKPKPNQGEVQQP